MRTAPVRDVPSTAESRPRDGHPRGQSLVEFALVLPMLLILLLGIADFARVFSAGITLEAAARNGAEIGALERLRVTPPPPGDPAEEAYYQRLHRVIAEATCAEARLLPNTTFQTSDSSCPSMPVIRACVRDGQDTRCGQPVAGFSPTVPAQCTVIDGGGWTNASGGETASHSVEVRICYQFTTLFNLDIDLPLGWSLLLGDVWLQRDRSFVVDCPPGGVTTC